MQGVGASVMKKLLLGVVSALAISVTAASATPPVPLPPIYSWSGFYVGINGGGGWADTVWKDPDTFMQFASHSGSGPTVGGQFGWRTQTEHLVWGVDFQGNWANITGSSAALTGSVDYSAMVASQVQHLGIFAATAGWAVDNVLVYVKGGAAWTGNKFTYEEIYRRITYSYIANEVRWGAALGAGVEYGFTPNWSFAVEYDHLFMGAVNDYFNPVPPASTGGPIRVYQDVDLITARVNYHFR